MAEFAVHTVDSAPEASKEHLKGAEKGFGFIPNLYGVYAEAPALLEGYATLSKIFGTSSLSPAEQNVVYLAASYENECHYCMAAHSVVGKMAGLDDETIGRLREGKSLADPKLEALRTFACTIVAKRGWAEASDLDTFFAAGYAKQQALEVILGLAVKTMSNYTNHLAQTPVDGAFKDMSWTKAAAE